MKAIVSALFLTILIAASSFAGDDWLIGTWKFDTATTLAAARTNKSYVPREAAPGVPDWVSPNPALICAYLDGAVIKYSATNETFTTKKGTEVKPYTVVKRPSSTEIVIRGGDTNTTTLRLVSGNLECDSNIGFKLYFSRFRK